jgi:acyl-CoA reductase-like NAD-dependent aldehyde dehydrogenase
MLTGALKHRPEASETIAVRMRLGGEWREGSQWDEIRDPYRGDLVSIAPRSTLADLDAAVSAAAAAKSSAAAIPAYERAALLRRAAELLRQRAEEIAQTMTRETGKALKDSRAEALRTLDTLYLSAEEAVRIEGEHVPLDATQMGAGKIAMLLRFPVGVVAGITPFNAPLNLAAHKIAPALAAGNAIVLKPPPQAPLTVHKLIEVFVDAGTPAGLLNAIYGDEAGPALVRDPRVDFISFTGSTRVGAEIKAASGLKRVTLELGGAGPTIVHDDAPLEEAASLCARNGMRLAGQSCISVQNVYVHRAIAPEFINAVVRAARALKVGDPLDPETDVGTLVDERAAQRVEAWIVEAVAAGATLLTGGARRGAQVEPAVLTNVRPEMKVVCEEVFGPTVTIQTYDDIEQVFETVSRSRFGLHCGVFTASLPLAIRAVRGLRTGGVILNGTSTWRTDQLPYGGVKDSGIGREGPRYSIRDMTEERLVVFNL